METVAETEEESAAEAKGMAEATGEEATGEEAMGRVEAPVAETVETERVAVPPWPAYRSSRGCSLRRRNSSCSSRAIGDTSGSPRNPMLCIRETPANISRCIPLGRAPMPPSPAYRSTQECSLAQQSANSCGPAHRGSCGTWCRIFPRIFQTSLSNCHCTWSSPASMPPLLRCPSIGAHSRQPTSSMHARCQGEIGSSDRSRKRWRILLHRWRIQLHNPQCMGSQAPPSVVPAPG